MPREVKQKVSTAVVRKKKKNGYVLPESIPLGEILTDLTKNQWKIGPSIGIGGFGEIYSACNAKKPTKKVEDYEYVVKIEPSENGPLFVEMHFYKRNAKQEDLKTFIKAKGLKSLGMPYLLGSGSHEINGKKHRFIVMPRYGQDIWSAFLTNNNKLPEHTIYRLAIQMLDVYEYIHQCTYVHADLKGANILLGFGKTGGSQAYLVDFGLASHYTTKDFKPDPKKMHNGTIEYTSRDAHLGVPTMRGDFEILCYNIIHWSGVTLPWEADKLLTNPGKVQKSKEDFMKTPDASLKKLYEKRNIPESIKQYMKYVTNLQFNESPDYDKCRKIFETGLKTLGKPNSGNLELKFATVSMTNVTTKKRAKSPVPVEIIEESDSDSVVLPSPKEKLIKRSPMKRKPIRTPSSISPKKSKIIKTSPSSVGKKETKKKINYSPVVNINKNLNSSATKKYGKTIINDNLTPNATNSKKTYEFNFDLDVSLDANVIVNVNRKKKAKTTKNNDVNGDEKSETPEPRVFIRKLSSRNSNSTTPKQKSK